MKDLNEIAKSSNDSYHYAKSLNFKNVPLIIIESIAKRDGYSYNYASHYSYNYAHSLHFKNVPEIIIKSISKDTIYSYWYAEHLNFKNVPLIILKSALNYYAYFTYGIKNFPENKQFLLCILRFDKRTNIIM